MSDNKKEQTNFSTARVKKLEKLYSDEMSTRRRYDKTTSYSTSDYQNAAAVRKALAEATVNKENSYTVYAVFAYNDQYFGPYPKTVQKK